jgi:cyclophilin family peptidyl-prolyl cis-trans isomerase
MSRLPLPVALALACALILGACGGSSKEKAASTAAPTATGTPAASQTTGCQKVAKPAPRKPAKLAKPTQTLQAGKTYVAHVVTNCGEFDIALDPKRAPKTGGSFKYLADKKFFDNLTFHRIVPGFVIQGGDPQGNGSGGPGYSVKEAPPQDLAYTKGVVAMAKTGTEPAGTSGSQFFVVTGEDAQLPPDYALLGKVSKGQDVVDRIGVAPAGSDEQPTDPIVIKSVRVSGS